jgi:hypothetical protein
MRPGCVRTTLEKQRAQERPGARRTRSLAWKIKWLNAFFSEEDSSNRAVSFMPRRRVRPGIVKSPGLPNG